MQTRFRRGPVARQFRTMAILMVQDGGSLHTQDHPRLAAHDASHIAGIPHLSHPPRTPPATPEKVLKSRVGFGAVMLSKTNMLR